MYTYYPVDLAVAVKSTWSKRRSCHFSSPTSNNSQLLKCLFYLQAAHMSPMKRFKFSLTLMSILLTYLESCWLAGTIKEANTAIAVFLAQ